MEISLSERPFAFFQKGQMCRIYRQLWKVNDMADMVKVEHLKKNFGDLEVLKDINLTVKEGEKLVIIGPSGSGKSTFIRCINHLEDPTAGTISIAGTPVTKKNHLEMAKKYSSMVFQQFNLYPHLTVLENLKIGAYLRKDDLSEDLEWVYSLFPRLKERSWQAGGTLSGGEQQMLAVGRALMSRPKLLMMDEPSLGLAPLVVRDIFSIIQEINKQGVTILLIEQNANMALKIADIGYVLETGRITLTGSGEELLTNDAVRAAYLGA